MKLFCYQGLVEVIDTTNMLEFITKISTTMGMNVDMK